MLPKGSFATLANGFQFHYHDGGQGDVVLFLHGSGTGASGFTNFKKNIDFKIDDLVFKPISYMHHKLQVFGYRLFNFAYITDLKTIKNKDLEKLMNLDCLVLNALRHKEHYSHINLNQALEMIEILKPKTTYLTHIAPDMGFHAETEKLLPENVYLAYDGLQIEVD
jgi:phosphoribosyl 1,2-cyclic phosphate phosphodiesterase